MMATLGRAGSFPQHPTGSRISPSTFFFRWLTGAVAPAVLLCTATFYVFLLLAFRYLIRAMRLPGSETLSTTGLLLLGSTYLLLICQTFSNDRCYTWPLGLTSHLGSTICGLVLLALTLSLLATVQWKQTDYLKLALTGLLTTLTVASDRLLLGQWIAPLVFCLVALQFRGTSDASVHVSWKRVGVFTGLFAAASYTGLLVLRQIIPTSEDAISNYTHLKTAHAQRMIVLTLQNIASKCQEGNVLHLSMVVWNAWSVAYLFSAWRCSGRTGASYPLTFLSLLGPILFLASLAGFILRSRAYMDHSFNWEDRVYRYFYPAFLVPFFGWAIWLRVGVARFPERPATQLLPAALSLLCVVWLGSLWFRPHMADRSLWNYYPEHVRQLDEAADKYGFRYGFAGYWEARPITLFSRKGLRAYPVQTVDAYAGVTPFHWLGNIEWYAGMTSSRHPKPSFQFIMLDSDQARPFCRREPIIERHGEPGAEVLCGVYPVLIYHRSSDSTFQHALSNHPEVFAAVGAKRIYDPVSSLPSEVIPGKQMQERVAVSGKTPAGFLTYGPYIPVKEPGPLRIVYHTSNDNPDKSNGQWDVIVSFPEQQRAECLVWGMVTPGDHAETCVELNLPPSTVNGKLEFRVRYTGEGRLAVHGIDLIHLR